MMNCQISNFFLFGNLSFPLPSRKANPPREKRYRRDDFNLIARPFREMSHSLKNKDALQWLLTVWKQAGESQNSHPFSLVAIERNLLALSVDKARPDSAPRRCGPSGRCIN